MNNFGWSRSNWFAVSGFNATPVGPSPVVPPREGADEVAGMAGPWDNGSQPIAGTAGTVSAFGTVCVCPRMPAGDPASRHAIRGGDAMPTAPLYSDTGGVATVGTVTVRRVTAATIGATGVGDRVSTLLPGRIARVVCRVVRVVRMGDADAAHADAAGDGCHMVVYVGVGENAEAGKVVTFVGLGVRKGAGDNVDGSMAYGDGDLV